MTSDSEKLEKDLEKLMNLQPSEHRVKATKEDMQKSIDFLWKSIDKHLSKIQEAVDLVKLRCGEATPNLNSLNRALATCRQYYEHCEPKVKHDKR